MPYKNPEDKRLWEREHREQRNAQRRQRLGAPMKPILPKPAPDPISDQQAESTWKVMIGFALAIGITLLAAWGGVSLPNSEFPRSVA